MSKKFLGKVIAGAALGGASLLVWAPSTALADGGYHPDGYQKHDSGRVFAKPEVAKPGQEVKFIEVCSEPQQHAWLWSKVTGKVDLAPKDHKEGYEADKKAEESKGGWDDGGKKPEESPEHAAKPGDPGSHESSGEEYKKEREYQEFLKYKEQQEYLEYRRYKEKSAPAENGAPRTEGAPSAEEGAPAAPGPSAGAVPAPPSPSANGQLPQPADGYQPPAGGPAPGGVGGSMADDGKAYEEGKQGWDDGKKAEEGKDGWTDKKAEEGKQGWDDSKKAEESKPGWDEKKAEEHKQGWDDKKAEEGKDGWTDEKAGYEYWAGVTIPWDAKPGTYELKGSCGEGELIITPKGWVDGGDGGATSGNSDNLAVAGVGMLGMAALGGLVLMRQRRTDESHA
ncbi:hypothetical protein [Plantactinospora soyae]|uniref:Gram-positive cocci surface proteins LPxTG domain-containing protein n=1 Tax=Plantactinospora soyae TaxID=1544732 RepID=A0A927QUL0_9ACTN|nr:hypothetical protein [Plantactinospora soyae]MBE1484695.1 hypothetical protein [Plantactinospora soyae]